MRRQRGELVPIGDALSGMGGPVKAIREASPQAQRHFTVADQVNQLVSASEADADLGFIARLMVLCSLPRTNSGNQHQYKRVNGPYRLILSRTGEYKLPFGRGGCCVLMLLTFSLLKRLKGLVGLIPAARPEKPRSTAPSLLPPVGTA